jgi:hypothetical protein
MRKIYLTRFLCKRGPAGIFLWPFLLILFFTACEDDEKIMNLTIASRQIVNEMSDYVKCYIVKVDDAQE